VRKRVSTVTTGDDEEKVAKKKEEIPFAKRKSCVPRTMTRGRRIDERRKKSAVVDHGGASTGWLPRLVFYLKQRTKGANEINLIKGMMHLLA
jgi:hypothetical protein